MRLPPSIGRVARVLALAACFGIGPMVTGSARPDQDARAQPSSLHFPDVQVHGSPAANVVGAWAPSIAGDAPAQPRVDAVDAPAGQEGFGDSVIEVQNLGDQAGAFQLAVNYKTEEGEAARAERSLEAGAATVVDLARLGGIGFGDFTATLQGDARLGAIARTRWPNGAAAAYRAPEASAELVLPLVVANVLGQSTIFAVQNTSAFNLNPIEVSIYDNEDGGILQNIVETLEPSQAATWDTYLDRSLFSPPNLPDNAFGGYVGSLRIKAYEPVSTLAYGEALEGRGSSAYGARPASAASPVQYLPIVRSGSGGDSLIGIANPGGAGVDVTVTYREMAGAGSGSAEPPAHTFHIGPRGTAIVDLSDRRRGNRPPPALGVFAGSATIEASGPVLSASIEDRRVGEAIDTVAAYNAFGPADLGTELALPRVRRAAAFATTAVAVFNPGPGDARVALELYDAANRRIDGPVLDVAEGSVARVSLADVPAFAVGTGRAVVNASRPVAVLAYEERDTSVKPTPEPVRVTLVQIMDSGVSGRATLTQAGSALDVELRIDGGSGSANASLHDGTCSLTPGNELHALNDVAAGYSSTQLPGVNLAELSDGAHAIRVHTQGFRGGRRQLACGIIPYLARAEDTDLSAVEALVIEAGAVEPTEAPTMVPTPIPSATATATGPEPTVSPQPTDGTSGGAKIYLPVTRRSD